MQNKNTKFIYLFIYLQIFIIFFQKLYQYQNFKLKIKAQITKQYNNSKLKNSCRIKEKNGQGQYIIMSL